MYRLGKIKFDYINLYIKHKYSSSKFASSSLIHKDIAAARTLPGCQDTGTAIVIGKKGQYVWVDGDDEEVCFVIVLLVCFIIFWLLFPECLLGPQ